MQIEIGWSVLCASHNTHGALGALVDIFSYRLLTLSELQDLLFSWAILVGSGALSATFFKSDFKLRRPFYAFIFGIVMLVLGIRSACFLAAFDAIKGGYLSQLTFALYGVLIPIGALMGICSAARSRDAYGSSDKWAYGLIPILNLMMLFAPSQENAIKTGFFRRAGKIAVVSVGIILVLSGQLVRLVAEKQAEISPTDIDPELEKKIVYYELHSGNMASYAAIISQELSDSKEYGEFIKSKRFTVEGSTLNYTFEVFDKDYRFSEIWRDSVTNDLCEGKSGMLVNAGAKINQRYLTDAGTVLAELSVDAASCDQWASKLDSKMKQVAKSIDGVKELNGLNLRVRAEYNDKTLSIRYIANQLPDEDWENRISEILCNNNDLRIIMGFNINIHTVFLYGNRRVGDFSLNSQICDARSQKSVSSQGQIL